MKNIIVKAYNQAQNSQEVVVQTRDGEPTIIQAENFTNYEFVNEQTGFAPDHIITKRVGNDLHLSFEEDGQNTDLIIENFYSYDQALIGQAENGNYYYYVPDAGEIEFYVTELANNTSAGQALGGDPIASPLWIPVSAASFPWGALALLALPIGVLASVKDDDDNTPSTTANSNNLAEPSLTAMSVHGTSRSIKRIDLTAEKPELKNASTFELLDPNDGQAKKIVTIAGVGTWTVADLGIIEFAPAEALLKQEGQPPEITYVATIGNEKISAKTAVHLSYSDSAFGIAGREVVSNEAVTTNDLQKAPDNRTINFDSLVIVDKDDVNKVLSTRIGDTSTYTVANEGTWTINHQNGKITFSPQPGFTAQPTPIYYSGMVSGKVGNKDLVTKLEPTQYTIEYHEVKPDSGIGTQGNPALINVIANDQSASSKVLPETLKLIDPITGEEKLTVNVPDEGTWTAKPTTGEVEFKPNDDFKNNPSPINYTIEAVNQANEKIKMPPTPVTIIYPSLTQSDFKVGTAGQPTTVNVLNNDFPADNSTLKLIDPTTKSPTDKDVTIAGEGTWNIVRDNAGNPTGEVKFIPVAGFTKNPTPIEYIVDFKDQSQSNPTKIQIVYQNEADTHADVKIAETGKPVTINVIENDHSVKPETLTLINPTTGEKSKEPNGQVTIPDQGVWTVNPNNGTVTFTPNAGFTDSPKPINYLIEDSHGKALLPTPVQIIYKPSATTTPITTIKPVAILLGEESVRETAGKAIYTVQLDKEATEAITITYQVTAGSASENNDYIVSNQTVTIPKGQKEASFSVEIKNDADPEANETYTVTLVSSNQANIQDDKKAIQTTIIDDDSPVVTPPTPPVIQPIVSLIGEESVRESAGKAVYTVELDKEATETTIITYQVTAGSASENADYAVLTQTVTIPKGGKSASFSVEIKNDKDPEANETYTVTLVSSNQATIKDDKKAVQTTIIDDDTPVVPPPADAPVVSLDGNHTVLEGNDEYVVHKVTLDKVSDKDVTVDYIIKEGSASEGKDYSYNNYTGTVLFKAGETVKEIRVKVLNDRLNESNESYNVTLVNPSNAKLGKLSATATITDNDRSAVSKEVVEQVRENLGEFTFTDEVKSASINGVDISNASATNPVEVAGQYGKVIVTKFDPANKSFSYAYEGNYLDHSKGIYNDELTITQTTPDGKNYEYGMFIKVNDSAPVAQEDKATLSVKEDKSGVFSVTKALAGDLNVKTNDKGEGITIKPTTQNGLYGKVVINADGTYTYEFNQENAFFKQLQAGQTETKEESITYTVLDVDGSQTTATLKIAVTMEKEAITVTPPTPPVALPVVSLSGVEAVREDAGKAQYTVELDKEATEDVVVTYTVTAGTATAGQDYAVTSQSITIKKGEKSASFTVDIKEDTTVENSENYVVSINKPTNAELGKITSVTTSIVDNDNIVNPPPAEAPTVSLDGNKNVLEGNDKEIVHKVRLDKAYTQDVSVDYEIKAGNASEGSDYSANTYKGTVLIKAGQTEADIVVNVLDDTADEPNETYTLTISNPTNAKLGSASAVATIRDNDFANLNREVVENTTQTLGEFSFSNVKSATILGTEITTATPAQPVEVAGTHGKILITGYNASTGTFTFSYASNGYKDHSDTAKTYEDEFVVKVTTANNEVHDRHIFIKTNDSVPTATADSATLAVKEDKTGTFAVTEALAGDLNVLTNDKGESIQVKPETLTGTYGTLTLNANGTYTYDFNKENTFFKNLTKGGSAQRNDTFKYKVIDADGSETEGSLNVVVKMEKELDGGSTTPVNPPSAEPSVYLDGDKVIVEGNGDSVTHKVKLTQASTETVTVNYTITAGSASVGSDFNAVQTGTITFNPGETEKDIRVEILNDLIPEGDTPENYTVELSNAVKAKLGIKDKVETKIYDNDQPALNTEVVEALSGDNSLKSTPIYPNANFTSVKINGQDISQGTVTLTGKYGTWTISDYNPTTGQFKNSYLVNEGLDHNGKEYVEDFAVELVATDGTRYEQGISFKVTDSVPTATDLTGTVEIRNDGTNVNAPVLTGSVQATGIDGNIKFKPQTVAGKYGTITIDENGQYTYDVDENNAEVKALQQGSTLTDDTVEYEITDADGSVGKNKLTFVIKSIDNSTVTPPPPASEPVVTLLGDKEVNENAGKATYTVTLDKEASEDVVVTYTVTAGTATEGADYVPATTKTVTIAKGQKSASFEVEIKEDTDVEGDETYTVAIVKPTNAQLGTSSVETTIKDNDTAVTPPTVAEPVVTLSGNKEVNENAGKATYTVTLDKEASEDVVITYTVTAGTATEGTDYVPATTKTVTIAKGQKSASFEVEIKEDTNTENDETYTVAIVKPSNAQLGTSSVETTIKDNDTAVTPPPSAPLKVALTGADRVHENVQKAQLIADKSNDNFVEYTVSLDGNAKAPAGGVEVEYTVTLGTASAEDFVNLVKTGKVIIPEGQSSATFKVQIADDKEIEGASTFGAENYTVSIAKPANAEVVSGKTEVTTRILDNDHRPLETTVTAGVEQKLPNYPIVVPSSYNSAFMTVDTGFEAEHHIDLTKASPTNPVEVKGQHGTLIVKGYNAAGELDMYYTANGTQAVKETFTLKYHSIIDDREYHRDIIINVTDGAVPPPPPPPASTEPKISIEGKTSVYEDNGDKFVTYKVKLDKAPEAGKDVKVTYTVSSTSASNETDYGITPEIGILTFTGTETEKEIRVEIKGDLVKEERENFTVILSNPENATITTNSVRTEIVDNDLNPTDRSVPEMTTRELGTFDINGVETITSNGSRDFKTATPANPIEVQGKFGKLIVTNYDPASGGVVYSYRSETDKDNTNGEKEVFVIEGKDANNIVFTKPIYIEITDGVVTPPPATVPVVSLEGEATVAEDGKSVTYKVKLDKAPASGQTVEVEYTILEGSAKLGSEFTTANGTLTDKLTFTGTETEKTFTVNITDDTVVDGDKNFKVYLSKLTNADYDNNRKEIETVIKDNDVALPPPALPEISIEGLTSVTEDAVTEVVYKVKLNKAPEAGQTVSVNYAVADGSALNGSDYEINPASGTLTFTGTETEKEIRVTIKGDTVQESAKTFSVTLSNIQNATLVGNSAVTTEILDNDLDSQNFSVVEGKNTETFTLSHLKASEYESITLGGEALQTGKTITTPKGVVTVVSYNDVSGEAVLSYESVSAFDHSGGTTHEDVIALTAVKNGVPLNANVTFNITDSEPKPQNDVANATVVKNGNDITLGAITGVLNVLDNDSVVADKKDAIKLTPHANIELGHGTLTLNGDGTYTYELSQRGKEKIAQMKNGEVFKDEYLYMVTDADNDTETASLTINFTVDDQTPAPKPQLTLTGSASVGEGQSAKYQLTVDQALTDDLIVSYEIVNGDGKRITNGTHTVTVPKTQAPNTPFEFDVAINNDGDVDGNHTYTLKVVSTNSPDVEINNDAKTGISTEIIEDDVVKVVVNLDQDQTVTEKAGEDVVVTHTFNLNKAHTEKVKVFFEITGDTNQIEAPANNFVEINAGDTSASITVKVKADKVDDPDHKYTINITNVENAEKGTTTPSITTTIHDNDEVLPAVAQTFTEGQTQNASFTDSRFINAKQLVLDGRIWTPGMTIPVHSTHGHHLEVTDFDPATGKVSYTFTGAVIDNNGGAVKIPVDYVFEVIGEDGKEYKKALDISVSDGELLVSPPQGAKLEFTRKGSTIQPAGMISGTLGIAKSDEVVEIKLDKPATFGTFTVTPDGKYTYDLDEANADLLKMENGKNTVETIELTVTDRDGTTKQVSFNIDLTAKVETVRPKVHLEHTENSVHEDTHDGTKFVGGKASYTVVLSEETNEEVTVTFKVEGSGANPADPSKDLKPFTTTVTIPANTINKTFELEINPDREIEGGGNFETYTVTLVSADNADLSTTRPISRETQVLDNDWSPSEFVVTESTGLSNQTKFFQQLLEANFDTNIKVFNSATGQETAVDLKALGSGVEVQGKEGKLVLTKYDPTTGQLDMKFDSNGAKDHTGGQTFEDVFMFKVTGKNGREYHRDLTVKIQDSNPTTAPDSASIGFKQTATGVVESASLSGDTNVLTNDKLNHTGDALKVQAGTFDGQYTEVTFAEDGSYTVKFKEDNAVFKALQNGASRTENDAITYTVVDADGQSKTETLNLRVAMSKDAVTQPPAQPFVALQKAEEGKTSFIEGETMTYKVTLYADAQMTQPYQATRTAPLTVAFDVKNFSETLQLANDLVIGGGADAVAKTITIPVNSNSATFTVMRPENNTIQRDGKFIVELKPSSDYELASKAKVDDVTLKDNDQPTTISLVSITAAQPTVGEGDGKAVFTIALDKPNTKPVEVVYEVVAVQNGGQMTVVQNQKITIPANESSYSLELPILDTAATGNGKYEVRITPVGGNTGVDTTKSQTAAITVIDNEPPRPNPNAPTPNAGRAQWDLLVESAVKKNTDGEIVANVIKGTNANGDNIVNSSGNPAFIFKDTDADGDALYISHIMVNGVRHEIDTEIKIPEIGSLTINKEGLATFKPVTTANSSKQAGDVVEYGYGAEKIKYVVMDREDANDPSVKTAEMELRVSGTVTAPEPERVTYSLNTNAVTVAPENQWHNFTVTLDRPVSKDINLIWVIDRAKSNADASDYSGIGGVIGVIKAGKTSVDLSVQIKNDRTPDGDNLLALRLDAEVVGTSGTEVIITNKTNQPTLDITIKDSLVGLNERFDMTGLFFASDDAPAEGSGGTINNPGSGIIKKLAGETVTIIAPDGSQHTLRNGENRIETRTHTYEDTPATAKDVMVFNYNEATGEVTAKFTEGGYAHNNKQADTVNPPDLNPNLDYRFVLKDASGKQIGGEQTVKAYVKESSSYQAIQDNYNVNLADARGGKALSGNLLTNDAKTTVDGEVKVFGVFSTATDTFPNVHSKFKDNVGGTAIVGQFGTLTVQANGDYVYTPDPTKVPATGARDIFQYLLGDRDTNNFEVDGTKSAQIFFTFNDSPSSGGASWTPGISAVETDTSLLNGQVDSVYFDASELAQRSASDVFVILDPTDQVTLDNSFAIYGLINEGGEVFVQHAEPNGTVNLNIINGYNGQNFVVAEADTVGTTSLKDVLLLNSKLSALTFSDFEALELQNGQVDEVEIDLDAILTSDKQENGVSVFTIRGEKGDVITALDGQNISETNEGEQINGYTKYEYQNNGQSAYLFIDNDINRDGLIG